MTATVSCTGAQTVAPKGQMALTGYSAEDIRIILCGFELITVTMTATSGAKTVAPKVQMAISDLLS